MERALFLIKPAAIEHETAILQRLDAAGFTSIIRLTREQAEDFLNSTTLEPKENDLNQINSYVAGITAVFIIEKFNAYESLSEIIGRPSNRADDGLYFNLNSLNASYGDNFYASTNVEIAEQDIRFFFPNVLVEPLCPPQLSKSFLDNAVHPVLTAGLVALCKEKPLNPVEWLGEWLLSNNPNSPKVQV